MPLEGGGPQGRILNVVLKLIFPKKVGDFQDIALFRRIAGDGVPESLFVAEEIVRYRLCRVDLRGDESL